MEKPQHSAEHPDVGAACRCSEEQPGYEERA